MRSIHRRLLSAIAVGAIFLGACSNDSNNGTTTTPTAAAPDTDPPEVQVGERLFLETRFAEFFFANASGDVNTPLSQGDPVVDEVRTTGAPLPGPLRGLSMNCRQCHMVDELKSISRHDIRTYGDFASRSPIPAHAAQFLSTAPRNSPPLINATLPRDVPPILHFDGEFATPEDLVVGTLTGPNFGWLPTEHNTAVSHIADVIRNDNGQNDLAQSFGGGGIPYSTLLLGTDPSIPSQLVIPAEYRIDVSTATDDQVLLAIAHLMHAYLDSLRFSTDNDGQYNSSPYDVFLQKNNLPRSPDPGESALAYAQRLLGLINSLPQVAFVTPRDAPPSVFNDKPEFQIHKGQRFAFGSSELQGLKIFFSQSTTPGAQHSGNCASCHTPPNFSDFRFHNTGASQVEYDAVFGSGAFAGLTIPDLATRSANFDQYLPSSPNHPNATSRFRLPASIANPGFTDLGLWNVIGNPDTPNPQTALLEIMCGEFGLSGSSCADDAVLPLSIAYFKTPTVRDLGQSSPYLHNGSLTTIEDVITFYIQTGSLARNTQLRNASQELSNVDIDATDVSPLAAFLRALNEDYD